MRGDVGRKRVPVGLTRRIAASVSLTSAPSNARLPVNISNNTQPKAQTSLRLSAARPLACSGLMYAAVPRITPICVSAGLVIVGDAVASLPLIVVGSNALANPKSRTLTAPSDRILMFAGFRSR